MKKPKKTVKWTTKKEKEFTRLNIACFTDIISNKQKKRMGKLNRLRNRHLYLRPKEYLRREEARFKQHATLLNTLNSVLKTKLYSINPKEVSFKHLK